MIQAMRPKALCLMPAGVFVASIKAIWHSLEYLESGSVLMESEDGRYEPLKEEELFKSVELRV